MRSATPTDIYAPGTSTRAVSVVFDQGLSKAIAATLMPSNCSYNIQADAEITAAAPSTS